MTPGAQRSSSKRPSVPVPSSAEQLFAIFDSSNIRRTRNVLDQVTKVSSENSALKPYLVEWLDEFKDWFDHAPAETLLADEASLVCASIALLKLNDPAHSIAFLASLRTKLERPECQGKYALEQILFQTLQSIESETFRDRGGGGTIVADLIALADQLLKRFNEDVPYVYSSTYSRYIPRLCCLCELFIHLGNLDRAQFSLEQLDQFVKKLNMLCLAATSVNEPYFPFVYQLERIRELLAVMDKATTYSRRQRLAYVGHGLVGLLYSVQIVRSMIFELKIDRDSLEGAIEAFKSMRITRGLSRQTSSSDLLRNLHALTITMLSTADENSTTTDDATSSASSSYFQHLPSVLALKIKNDKERIYFRYGLVHQLTSLATGSTDTSLRDKSVGVLVSQISNDDWMTDPAVTHALFDGLCCIAAHNQETDADYIYIKRSLMALSGNPDGSSSSSSSSYAAGAAGQKKGLFRRLGNKGRKQRESTSSSSSVSSLFQKWLGSDDLSKKISSFRPIEVQSSSTDLPSSEADSVFRQVKTRISTKRLPSILGGQIDGLRADLARGGPSQDASRDDDDDNDDDDARSSRVAQQMASLEQAMTDVSELVERLKRNPASLTESQRIAILSKFIAEGAKNATLASNQELVLVLGVSGAGKSTFLNYLFGCKMRLDLVNDRPQISVDDGGREEILKIGHDGSETLLPQLHVHAHGANPSVVYCDCPGFIDTRGAVVNIANAVNIRAALQCSKGAKVIVLIPYKDIDARSHGFTSTIDTCKQLFGGASKLLEHSNAVLVGITRVDLNDDNRPSRRMSVAAIKQQLQSARSLKDDPLVQALLTGDIGMFLHDPLDNGRADKGFWSHAESIRKITKLSSVPNPASVFKTTLNAGDEKELSLISRTTQQQIHAHFSNKSYVEAAVRMRSLEQLGVVDHPVVSRLLTETHNRLEDVISRQVVTFKDNCLANRFDVAEGMLSDFQLFENYFPQESNRLLLHYLPKDYEREKKNYEDRKQSMQEVETLRMEVAAGAAETRELVERLEKEKQRVEAERDEVEERHTTEIALLRKEMSLTRSSYEEQIRTINASMKERADELDAVRTTLRHNQSSDREERRRVEETLDRLERGYVQQQQQLVAAQQAQAASNDRFATALANQQSLLQTALAQKDAELASLSSKQLRGSHKLGPYRKEGQQDLDAAIEAGDWVSAGATAALLATGSDSDSITSQSSAGTTISDDSLIDADKAAKLNRLIEAGDWEGVVAAAARYESDGYVASAANKSKKKKTKTKKKSTSTPGSTSSKAKKRQEIRAVVEDLVKRVVPKEIENVDEMMLQFRGREEELVETLRTMEERQVAQRAPQGGQKVAKEQARRRLVANLKEEEEALAQAEMWMAIANETKKESGAGDAADWAIARSLNALAEEERAQQRTQKTGNESSKRTTKNVRAKQNEKKYRSGPTKVGASPVNDKNLQDTRAIITDLISKTSPREIENVDEMMLQFKGREDELIETLQFMHERQLAKKGQNQAPTATAQQNAAVGIPENLEPAIRKAFANLCTCPSGVLFENSLLQIGIKHEYVGERGRMTIFFGNIGKSPLRHFRVAVDEYDHLKVQKQGKQGLLDNNDDGGCTVAVRTQAKLELSMEVKAPFDEAPKMRVIFKSSGGESHSYSLRLPIVLTCFVETLMFEATDFMTRWKSLEGNDRECQEVVKAPPDTLPVDEEYMNRIAKTITDGLRFGRCEGCDPASSWTVWGAGTFRTGSKDMSGNNINVCCLIRVEGNPSLDSLKITVRTLHPQCSKAVLDVALLCIKSQVF